MQHISFPSIEQFRSVVGTVRKNCDYYQKDYPKLTFEGTVKIHGTNAGVGFDPRTGELWCQSRENIITVEKDNAGFAFFVKQREEYFKQILSALSLNAVEDEVIVVFGEFAGGNIQKGVAVSGLPKFFVAFDVCFAKSNEDKSFVGCHDWFNKPELLIFNSYQFPTFKTTIDFSNAGASSEFLETLTNECEQCCPVGKYFGVEGIGEGLVWKFCFNDTFNHDLIFKVKGEKHSVSKVKKGTGVAAIAPEVQESIEKFVEYAVTEQRLEQGIQRVFTEKGIEPDVKETGTFLKWVFSDVMKEEHDVLAASGLEPKQVSGLISKAARDWFMKNLSL